MQVHSVKPWALHSTGTQLCQSTSLSFAQTNMSCDRLPAKTVASVNQTIGAAVHIGVVNLGRVSDQDQLRAAGHASNDGLGFQRGQVLGLIQNKETIGDGSTPDVTECFDFQQSPLNQFLIGFEFSWRRCFQLGCPNPLLRRFSGRTPLGLFTRFRQCGSWRRTLVSRTKFFATPDPRSFPPDSPFIWNRLFSSVDSSCKTGRCIVVGQMGVGIKNPAKSTGLRNRKSKVPEEENCFLRRGIVPALSP